jgi:hypothetical protein
VHSTLLTLHSSLPWNLGQHEVHTACSTWVANPLSQIHSLLSATIMTLLACAMVWICKPQGFACWKLGPQCGSVGGGALRGRLLGVSSSEGVLWDFK